MDAEQVRAWLLSSVSAANLPETNLKGTELPDIQGVQPYRNSTADYLPVNMGSAARGSRKSGKQILT